MRTPSDDNLFKFIYVATIFTWVILTVIAVTLMDINQKLARVNGSLTEFNQVIERTNDRARFVIRDALKHCPDDKWPCVVRGEITDGVWIKKGTDR